MLKHAASAFGGAVLAMSLPDKYSPVSAPYRLCQLSVTRQAQVLGINRASVYYPPRPVSEADLALMRQLDQLHPEYPSFIGARMLRDQLLREGV